MITIRFSSWEAFTPKGPVRGCLSSDEKASADPPPLRRDGVQSRLKLFPSSHQISVIEIGENQPRPSLPLSVHSRWKLRTSEGFGSISDPARHWPQGDQLDTGLLE